MRLWVQTVFSLLIVSGPNTAYLGEYNSMKYYKLEMIEHQLWHESFESYGGDYFPIASQIMGGRADYIVFMGSMWFEYGRLWKDLQW
jgi:hypothetical protein